jgi:hypothetical protein
LNEEEQGSEDGHAIHRNAFWEGNAHVAAQSLAGGVVAGPARQRRDYSITARTGTRHADLVLVPK